MSDPKLQQLLRQLPSVSELLSDPQLQRLAGDAVDTGTLKTVVRDAIETRRRALLAGESTSGVLDLERVATRARQRAAPSLVPVINATGVVVHTNLGRSPLPPAVVQAVVELVAGYTNLEYDLAAGQRGHRHVHAARLIARVTGAEAALVTNNCAAAVLLGLAGLAQGGEVIVSRGELVEIGGAFRVPDVMRQSGAELVEVGTTNRTRLADYEQAITERTRLLLKVHRSNFAVVGFTGEVAPAQLAGLGQQAGLPTMMDLGSGLVERPADPAFADEPLIRSVVADGMDLVTFSGDKLLGGPQAGILAGRAQTIARLAAHPLLRALRPDKVTLGLLEGVLALHAADRAATELPTVRMLHETAAEVALRRTELRRLAGTLPTGLELVDRPVRSRPGGGSLPLAELDSAGLQVVHRSLSATELHRRLRHGQPPVVGRIEDDQLLLDLRTVLPDQLGDLAAALAALDPARDAQ